MRANQAFELIVTRAGRGPLFLAPAERVDHVEVVEIDSGEVALFFDLPAREAARLARALREDLGRFDAEQFLDAWRPTQR